MLAGYRNLFFLNSGFGGSVHAAKSIHTGEIVAIKTVKRAEQNKASIARETSCVRTLNHSGIIKTYEIFETDSNIQYVQEYAEGGDLFDHLQICGFFQDEAFIKLLFSQIVGAVQYMHTEGFCHRDLKPENIVLITSSDSVVPKAKIIDFGLAEESRFVKGRVGTDVYSAPEVATVARSEFVDGFAADVWSLGVLLVFLLIGRNQWCVASASEDAGYAAFLERYRSGQRGAVFNTAQGELGLTSHLLNLLDGLLNPDPAARITLDEVRCLIDMPWTERNYESGTNNGYNDAKSENDMYTYKIQSSDDSGFSWGDDLPDELDFSTLPLPSFETSLKDCPLLAKTDSGVAVL